jgi:biotin transport system substrate-specific component
MTAGFRSAIRFDLLLQTPFWKDDWMSTFAKAVNRSAAGRIAAQPMLRDAMLVLACGSLMAMFARIAVYLPFTPVPITGQTLGVLLTGALLGSRRGALAMLVYLAEGLAGLPVFAGGQSAWSPSPAGVPVIIGPSAGYLFSYPASAFVTGWLLERAPGRAFPRALLAMLGGEAVIYAVGLPWLSLYTGAKAALPLGLLPFIPGDLAKAVLAAAVLPSGASLLARVSFRSR